MLPVYFVLRVYSEYVRTSRVHFALQVLCGAGVLNTASTGSMSSAEGPNAASTGSISSAEFRDHAVPTVRTSEIVPGSSECWTRNYCEYSRYPQ